LSESTMDSNLDAVFRITWRSGGFVVGHPHPNKTLRVGLMRNFCIRQANVRTRIERRRYKKKHSLI
jgi:hypothetical protein